MVRERLPPSLSAPESEVGPCRMCQVGRHCAPEQLACRAFVAFVNGAPVSRWQAAPRKPTHERYLSLYGRANR